MRQDINTKRVPLLLLMLMMAVVTMAQKVTGTVIDESFHEPLIGATVRVNGTQIAVITDLDGNFTLDDVPQKASITVSYVGYLSMTKPATAKMTFALKQNDTLLDEVVVVGYGATKKSNITGAVETVKIDDLPTAGDASLGNMLRGRSAGMNITQNNASPGGELNISIRGGLSGQKPLIVIDGVPQTPASNVSSGTVYSGSAHDGGMINLNPNDIEKIDILKDASAASIYGSDASGGVILITTKRGKIGKPEISYSGNVAFQFMKDKPEFLNARDFMQVQNEVNLEIGNEPRFSQAQIDAFRGDGTDWLDEVTRMGVVQEHNVSVTAGSEKTKYLFSLSYYNHNGIAKNNGMKRYTGRLNVDQDFNKWLKAGINSSFANVDYNDVPMGDARQENSALIYSAMTFLPIVPVYNEDGTYSTNYMHDIFPNPVSLLEITDKTRRRNLNISGYVELKPWQELTIRATAGIDMVDTQSDQYIPTTTRKGFADNGIASKQNAKSQMNLVNVVATFAKQWSDMHDLSIMGGWEYKKSQWEGMGIVARQFPYDGALSNNLGISQDEKPNISSYKGTNEMASLMSRVNYALMGKYIATINLRVDGSSNFSKKHQWAVFPGISLAWRMNEEKFLKSVEWLSNLKLRMGYGKTGNAGNLTGINTYFGVSAAMLSGGKLVNGISLKNLGNEDLKWETITDLNIGLDFGFLKNRITGTIDVYQRSRNDIIMQKALMSYNEVKNIDYNSKAEYMNRGVDVAVHTVNIDTKDFGWSSGISFSFYRNFTNLHDPDETIPLYEDIKKDWGDIYGYRTDGIIGIDGEVAYLPNSKPGAIKYLDLNGYTKNLDRDSYGRLIRVPGADGKLDEADMVKLFNNTPIPFSLNNTLRWKNWDLNIYLYGSLHGWKLNEVKLQSIYGVTDITGGTNALAVVKDRWTPTNQNAVLPGTAEATAGIGPEKSDFFYEKSWYLRLDNVSIGYKLPVDKWSKGIVKYGRIYASGRNLCIFTPYDGMDPETGNGIGAYPNQWSVAIGLDLKF